MPLVASCNFCYSTNVLLFFLFSVEVRRTATASCATFAILSKPHAKQKQTDLLSSRRHLIPQTNTIFF